MVTDNYMNLIDALMFTEWLSVSDLMEKTELGPRTIKAFMKDLIEDGYVQVKKVGKTDHYRYHNADGEMEDE